MKKAIIMFSALFPSLALAQSPAEMNQADMQAMMAQMQEMQTCMAQIDQAEIEALQQQGQRMETEIKVLCADGKRAEAQRKAITYGIQVGNSPAMQTMKECTKDMQAMMAQMPIPQMPYQNFTEDSQTNHVCDMH